MYNYHRNVNIHLSFFVRHQLIFWPLAFLFLVCCPRITRSIQNPNPDRTVAKLGPRQIQLTTSTTEPVTTNQQFDHHILYVISLDGKITALNAQKNGRQIWTADTGTPLVDSSLSKIEISKDSRSVRLIPSLIGGLYEKYDEDGHIEPLPFDADALLDASFKLHEELVITGGKHIDTLGLDLQTGQVLYSFAKDEAKILDNNRTTSANESTDQRPTLIVKRTTQTVRARSARNGYEKWNFSVSNHELLHLRSQSGPNSIVVSKVDEEIENTQTFSGYFEYQLQTGVVIAFDRTGQRVWSSAIHAPIAAVWELKNGELIEKSLFETKKTNQDQDSETYDDDDEEMNFAPPIARRLAFVGEFNSTPYVLIPSRVQKELILDARKNNMAGSIGHHRPILSSWHKAYQKRTLSIGYENDPTRITPPSTSESKYPLALRPDPATNPNSHLSSLVETCDTAGYLELIDNSNIGLIDDRSGKDLRKHSNIYIPSNTLILSTIGLGGLIFFCYLYLKNQRNLSLLKQQSISNESAVSIHITPPPTPSGDQQVDPPFTPLFQSRYLMEYDHVDFLGRGGFGVVFKAINKLDERPVAIKRVSLKKPSGKDRALKEIRYLAKLNHPNLIQYYYAWNESPPIGWEEQEEVKNLVVRKSTIRTRDSMSTFPTSANDSESIKSSNPSSVSAIPPKKSIVHSPPVPIEQLFEITFDRSTNPLCIDEDFPSNSIHDESSDEPIDANNNAKHSLSSSSSSPSVSFNHSSSGFSSNDKPVISKGQTESDDGIAFEGEEQRSPSPNSNELKAITSETKKSNNNEKDFSPVYFYFVMELCQPESLRDRLIQGKIDRQQAWSIFDQIAQGIEYIHSKNFIHRDLKPSNILFSMDNTVKIGDFGLVAAFGENKLAKKRKRDEDKLDQAETTSTTTTEGGCEIEELGGTILYMSPEQMNREPYSYKVDIYAMGIILFELLCPFTTQMERMHSLANVRLETPVFPSDFEHDTNNRNHQLICTLIRWLLSYSPAKRPKANELLHDNLYQRILSSEVPQLFSSDTRQRNQTMITEQEQALNCP